MTSGRFLGRIIPLLLFYAARFGASPQAVTILMAAVFRLVSMALAPLWGRLSDRIGRRPGADGEHARRGARLSMDGFCRLALDALRGAGTWPAACAGAIAAAQAYIADVTTPENRACGMGMVGAAFGLGFITGQALGGAVAGNDLATADLLAPRG